MKIFRILCIGVVFALTSSLACLAQTTRWDPGPDMSTSRYGFPLVELPSGKWLAAGGVVVGNGGFGIDAEILEEDAGSWTSASPMPSPHRGRSHGIRLLDGRILIAGEDPHIGPHPHPRSAYLYGEEAAEWKRTDNDPSIARFSATMTLLPDGRILYAGGYNNHSSGPTYRTAELYDPLVDTWSPTGSMAEVRTVHTATLLVTGPNAGKVLVVGGSDRAPSNTATAGCELYDPASGTWSAAASLNESRSQHTATLLESGEILVVGGQYTIGAVHRDSAEIYDPIDDTWRLASPLSGPRALHAAVLLPSGRVLVVGGAEGPGATDTLATAVIYDPVSDSWSPAAPMATPRFWPGAALLSDGRVIVAGGRNGNVILNSSEIFSTVERY